MTLSIEKLKNLSESMTRCQYIEAIDQLDAVVATFVVSHQIKTDIAKKLRVGLSYEVKLLVDGKPAHTAKGDIVEVRHSRRKGRHRITVVGLDSLHRLRGASAEAQVWKVTHDKIIKEIAKRNKLKAKAEGVSGSAGETLQNEGTDALFLRRLAAENNYYIRVSNGSIVFGRKRSKGKITLDYRHDIHEIEQKTSLDNILTKVTVHGSDYLQDKAFTGVATPSDLTKISRGTSGPALLKKMMGERELIINHSGYGEVSRAKARAKAELQARAEHFLQGSVWTDGLPSAVSGQAIQIKNAGWPLDGNFLIRQTVHTRSPHRYNTRIDFMSDSLPRES